APGAFQQPDDPPEWTSQRVPPGLSATRGLPRRRSHQRPSTFDFSSDDIRAVVRPVIDRRPVEPLHGPPGAPKDPVPLAIVLLTQPLVVGRAIRLDRHADIGEGE